jgi:pimeloyl-ACP methyl ester carboxylesterase
LVQLPPRLVLLPGLHGTAHLYEPLLKALDLQFSTIVIAYPATEALSYDDLLPFVRERLPQNKPFVLLGESFSGPLAIRLAAEHPDNLRGLILVATFARTPVRWLPAWSGRYLPSFPLRLLPLWGHLRLLTSGRSTPELQQLFQTALRQPTPAVLVHRIAEVLRVDVAAEFQRIAVPILMIAAVRDRIVPAHALFHLQQLRPDLHVERIDCGHLVLQTEPERAAEVIAEFIRKL